MSSDTAFRYPPVAAEKAPGGVVFQTWSMGQMIRESCVTFDHVVADELDDVAIDSASAIINALELGGTVELRFYDGDDGHWIATRLMTFAPAQWGAEEPE